MEKLQLILEDNTKGDSTLHLVRKKLEQRRNTLLVCKENHLEKKEKERKTSSEAERVSSRCIRIERQQRTETKRQNERHEERRSEEMHTQRHTDGQRERQIEEKTEEKQTERKKSPRR